MPTTDCIEWARAKTRSGYGVRWNSNRVKYVHRLAIEERIGRQLESHEVVMHSCDNPACYNIEHLSLGTAADNIADMHKKGRAAKGAMLPQTKLTDNDVVKVRALRASGARVIDIAQLFGVHQSHISRISAGKRRTA